MGSIAAVWQILDLLGKLECLAVIFSAADNIYGLTQTNCWAKIRLSEEFL